MQEALTGQLLRPVQVRWTGQVLGDSSPGEGGERQGQRQPQNKGTSVAGRERLEGEEPRSGRSDCIQQGLMNVG